MVGNASPMYESNVAYVQTSLQTINGSVPSLALKGPYGNELLKPEMRYEKEVGLDARFLENRLGIDVSYYSNNVKDQILPLSTPPSVGATKQIVNVGEISNNGLEIGLSATPISGAIRWETRLNYAFNRSKVVSLAEGVSELVFYEGEQSALKVVAKEGELLGNVYVYERAKDENGNLIINDDGLYVIDKTKHVKVGNIMPKAIGGFSNTITYKNFSLDFTIDYRFGGKMVSPPTKYMTGAGLLENTLKYRDAENGGLTYTVDDVTYNDGVLLEGVNQNTGEKNTKIISAADYYLGTFYWGGDAWQEKGSVFDNSYIKLREAIISYRIPSQITDKLHINNVRVSLIGRNLFYLYKTLENLDPEAPVGNKWWSQGIDLGSSAPTRSLGFSLNANF
jgi:iron complex outermembrane receptor protein